MRTGVCSIFFFGESGIPSADWGKGSFELLAFRFEFSWFQRRQLAGGINGVGKCPPTDAREKRNGYTRCDVTTTGCRGLFDSEIQIQSISQDSSKYSISFQDGTRERFRYLPPPFFDDPESADVWLRSPLFRPFVGRVVVSWRTALLTGGLCLGR
ncbi:hypothetical protein CDAR_589661 [Caerostris darwini]|uniref:Uncharacterized protein n=1 Tax=Caerostris darwini TaxID=1538125 RepID=A0AAV4PEV3_9ARAC|nr:hypothetical protein CDAR_589661 [Caerostris darwini]